jgi:predicted GNAT family N-acyltransferase
MNEIKKVNTEFYIKVVELLKKVRNSVVKTINKTMVYTYFEIGRIIVEEEQKGKARAEYGKQILKGLSKKLSIEFGKGFSVDNLENMRRFYLSYSISETPSRKSTIKNSETLSRNFNTPDFQLS